MGYEVKSLSNDMFQTVFDNLYVTERYILNMFRWCRHLVDHKNRIVYFCEPRL